MAPRAETPRRRRRVGRFVVALAVAAAALLGYGLLVEPRRVEPVDVAIRCGAAGTKPLRALLFSDVDFHGVGVRERAVRRAAEAFHPDLVLVAGDFFDHGGAIDDPALRDQASAFLASLPATSGRFLVPGETEAAHLGSLGRILEKGETALLVNASRRIVGDGGCVELFGANERTDPAPFLLGRDARHAYTFAREARGQPAHWLVYDGPGASGASEGEVSFAFQAASPRARVEIALGVPPGADADPATSWRLARHEGRHDFRAYAPGGAAAPLEGRIESGFAPPAGVWCRARMSLTRDGGRERLRAKLWVEDLAEPAGWSIDAERVAPSAVASGSIALGGLWGDVRYADLIVRDGAGSEILREGFDDPAGWRERWSSGSALQRWAEATAGSPCARIVLSHNPDVIGRVRSLGVPAPCVVLAGHTHGGQVRVPGLGALYTSTWIGRKYDRGLFDFGGVPLYITAGVGTSLVPIRLFDPPEVTLLTLEP